MYKEIKEKAKFCLGCKNKPCQSGCPLRNDTMEFIQYVKNEKYKEAYDTLCNTTVLPAICGRICPHDKQCEGSCIRRIKTHPVLIGDIEAFVGDMAIKEKWSIPIESKVLENRKVAVVGSGPAGLTAAAFLAKNGCDITIYEKRNSLGGLLEHGIPEFRLERKVVDKSIEKILDLGVKAVTNYKLNIDELEAKYDAILLAMGANVSSKMNIEGENLKGVYGANELLENKEFPDFRDKKVAVIGGGNVAIDASRTIKKLGAKKVSIIYRRAEEQMPAEKKEIEAAKNDGIEFLLQNNILRIIGKDKVEKAECVKTELVKKENEDRLSPVNVEGSNYFIDVDYVIMAVGSKVDVDTVNKLNVKTNKYGNVEVDERNMTSKDKIFASGDLIGIKATVAWAARSGRNAAYSIINYLKDKNN